MVVVMINGNNATTVMNATLADIFVDNGAAGTAPQVKLSWEVRDLWANRMSDAEAQSIITASSATGNATTGYNGTRVGAGRYNSTKTSYAEGLAKKDPLLLGESRYHREAVWDYYRDGRPPWCCDVQIEGCADSN